MKLFKHLREEALKKVSVGKVFEPTSSDDNKKDPAFSRKGKVATGDEGQLKYGAKNNPVKVTEDSELNEMSMDSIMHPKYGRMEWRNDNGAHMITSKADNGSTVIHALGNHKDIAQKWAKVKSSIDGGQKVYREDTDLDEEIDLDQKYSDWQDEVKRRNPEHAPKIRFKTNPDQRDTISAEHGDRSFGTFNTKTGEAIHLGEATEGNKFESAYDVVNHLAKAGYPGIQAKDVELYQGGRATARHRGSSASPHFGKYFSVNAAGDVKVHGDETSAIKAIKEEVELDEDFGYEKRDAKDSHLSYTQYIKKYYPSKYKGMWESSGCRVCGQTPCNCTFINEEYKEKNYEYKNKDGKTATLSCATYSNGDTEHFVHIKGQRATRHATKNKAHQSLRVRGYEPTGKVEEE